MIETRFRVSGVFSDRDVRSAMQALFDIFAANGIGQASFEINDSSPATLILKHCADARVEPAVIAAALADAGGFGLVDP